MPVRLQKYLAQSGIASRRASEKIILQGRVKVNGKIVRELGTKVDPDIDKVEVDGALCRRRNNQIYILLNKPAGVVTTVKDPQGRPTVIDMIKDAKERVFPVGRLDKETEGLLILTNDGKLTYRLTHPKYEVVKTYIVHTEGIVKEGKIKALEKGVRLGDGVTAPAQVQIIKTLPNSTILEMKIHEGKKRQIRRMCETIGHPVIYLKRTQMGKLSLKGLKIGEWRFLNREEVAYLKNL